MYPNENCKAEPKQCAMYNDAHSSAWRSTINKIHQNGSKIVFQKCNPGVRIAEPLERKSPTTFPGLYNSLTKTEIQDIIELFFELIKTSQKSRSRRSRSSWCPLLLIFVISFAILQSKRR